MRLTPKGYQYWSLAKLEKDTHVTFQSTNKEFEHFLSHGKIEQSNEIIISDFFNQNKTEN